MSDFVLVPMNMQAATHIATWSYPAPLDRYNIGAGYETYMCDPANHFVLIARPDDSAIIGFASLGVDGRVPGYAYDDSAVDFGFALSPEWIRRGLGSAAIRAVLSAYRRDTDAAHFRATVWADNAVMLHVLEGLGFDRRDSFIAANHDPYVVLTADAAHFE